MPQGRIVLKLICQSRKLANLKTDGARLLYTWLIPNVDVNGCFSGDVDVIRGQIFTRLKKSRATVASYLTDLEQNKLIIRYEANGDFYLQIPDFVDKQPSLNPNKEGKTNIPIPSQDLLWSNSGISPPKVKISKVKISKVKDICFCIFDCWNKYKGKSVQKENKKHTWKGHNLNKDDSLLPQIRDAIKCTLSKGYTVEQICGAIDNYAKILLGEDYFWSYSWTLAEFLTRGEEGHKNAPRKWLKFHPDEFIEERWLTELAKKKRANKTQGPMPYQLAKEQLRKQQVQRKD